MGLSERINKDMVNLSLITRLKVDEIGDMMLEEVFALKLSLLKVQKDNEEAMK